MEEIVARANAFDRGGEDRSHKVLTMIYVVDTDAKRVLLGHKARGFGAGNWNAFGGKVDPTDEDVRAGAIRELQEECGLSVAAPESMQRVAVNFYEYPADLQHKLFQVHVYCIRATEVRGDVVESEEMTPIKMIPFAEVPYDKMWADDPFWLPELLEKFAANDATGHLVGYFVFASYTSLLEGNTPQVAWGRVEELDRYAPTHMRAVKP
jgi:8-oxo-dGTP pyrophosphatase MutT (NUDIX family)